MSTEPVTLMVARRVRKGCYRDFLAWLEEGKQLASDFPGYLGSGVLAPPEGDDEFQIICRFADEASLAAWKGSASRHAWLKRGGHLFAHPHEHRAKGLDHWFAPGVRPPRWKQSVAIWVAFFPVSLAFQLVSGDALNQLPLLPAVLVSTLVLTPLMTYVFIPLSTRLLGGWLQVDRHAESPSTHTLRR
ncbi:antibiotic biosynthesis monooxygenase [Stutzerimonas tarimensis]|uniref:Antibiotic biosynthesis monooxygenase n=1 Tax=Stutzerimonas tarimensis TaxID=1507735 RepID=A0ABV7T7G7_9GAMM